MVAPEDNGGQHYIEESVSVCLVFDFDANVWRASIDGGALDSANPDAPFNGECQCGDRETCDAARLRTEVVSLPTAEELVVMLREAIAQQDGVTPAV